MCGATMATTFFPNHPMVPYINSSHPAFNPSGDKETAYELMREVLVGMMVNGFMEHIRKIWTPPMHQGSQSESYNEYRLMNCITADIMNAREREFDE